MNQNNIDQTDQKNIIPLDQDSHDVQEFLEDLQGNILKGHGREHTAHVFLRFGKDPARAKEWVKQFSQKITTASRQKKEARLRREAKASGKKWKETTFWSLVLSAQGYQELGVPENHIPPDTRFRNGMKHSRSLLKDPSPENWEEEYQDDIHAMVLVANENRSQLKADVLDLRNSIKKTNGAVLEIVKIDGDVIRHPETKGIVEHFGYIDGRSQPLFLKEDIDDQRRKEGIDQYDPSTPLNAVLVRESPLNTGQEHYGSYFVFRKLEQNVKGFKVREKKLATALKLKKKDEERAGALAVGRFEDGTPVTLQYHDGMHNPIFNNFNYKSDTEGSKCPFHGHIRKVNPRDQSVEGRAHRITRRGITYGKRRKDLKDQPEGNVGLLFMCFQADIGRQFEHLQIRANDTADGLDPIIGQTENEKTRLQQNWPPEWAGDDGKPQPFDFQGFVTLKGGEYFFAPSINFLRKIDQIK
jgi:Dyp-type peroxidase family